MGSALDVHTGGPKPTASNDAIASGASHPRTGMAVTRPCESDGKLVGKIRFETKGNRIEVKAKIKLVVGMTTMDVFHGLPHSRQ